MPNSEFRTCPAPEFPNVLHSNLSTRPMSRFWSTCLQRAYVIPCRQQMWSSAVLRARRSALALAAKHQRAHSIGRGCSVHTCITATAADFKMYLLRQFCSNGVDFFYNTQETQTQKNDGPEFWNSNSVIFENFWNFQKGVTLQLMWTIMVTAKLDHSRVLVTKFHQNRSMLKSRSAGQRHTDKLGWK